MAPNLTEKEKNHQIRKEAMISVVMYVAFLSGGMLPDTELQKKEHRKRILMFSDCLCGFS